jgi:peptidoglycan-associated lipoprotein
MKLVIAKGLILSILGGVFFAGCATEAAKKSEISAAKTPSASTGGPSTAKSATSRSETSTGSSLDAHREGKPPASGPLKEIKFEFDSYALSAEARSILQTNAAWLKANPAAQVEIEGHCDERGTTEYNLALGAKRARGAMDYLVSLGISPARIKTVSYGEELPLCKEKSEDCYRNNRRDRFVEARARPGA